MLALSRGFAYYHPKQIINHMDSLIPGAFVVGRVRTMATACNPGIIGCYESGRPRMIRFELDGRMTIVAGNDYPEFAISNGGRASVGEEIIAMTEVSPQGNVVATQWALFAEYKAVLHAMGKARKDAGHDNSQKDVGRNAPSPEDIHKASFHDFSFRSPSLGSSPTRQNRA